MKDFLMEVAVSRINEHDPALKYNGPQKCFSPKLYSQIPQKHREPGHSLKFVSGLSAEGQKVYGILDI